MQAQPAPPGTVLAATASLMSVSDTSASCKSQFSEAMRGDEYPIDDFSLKLEDLLTSTGQLTEQSEDQVRRRSEFDLICPP